MGYSCHCKQSCFAHSVWIRNLDRAPQGCCVCVPSCRGSQLEGQQRRWLHAGAWLIWNVSTWGGGLSLRWSTSVCYSGLFHVAWACSGMVASADHISYRVAQGPRCDCSTGKGRQCSFFWAGRGGQVVSPLGTLGRSVYKPTHFQVEGNETTSGWGWTPHCRSACGWEAVTPSWWLQSGVANRRRKSGHRLGWSLATHWILDAFECRQQLLSAWQPPFSSTFI